MLTNEQNVGLPDALGEWVLDRLMGNPEIDHVAAKLKAARAADAANAAAFDRPAAPRPPPSLAGLAGTYGNGSLGPAEIALMEDGLVATLTTTGARLKIAPHDGDVFVASLIPEGRFAGISANIGAQPLGFVQFYAGADGRLDRFAFTAQGDGQSYLFTRN